MGDTRKIYHSDDPLTATDIADKMEGAWKKRGPDDKFVSCQYYLVNTLLGAERELKQRGYDVNSESILNGVLVIVGETS